MRHVTFNMLWLHQTVRFAWCQTSESLPTFPISSVTQITPIDGCCPWWEKQCKYQINEGRKMVTSIPIQWMYVRNVVILKNALVHSQSEQRATHHPSRSLWMQGQLRVHRFSYVLFTFHPVASRSTDSERKTVTTCQRDWFAGAVMDRGCRAFSSPQLTFQDVSICLSTNPLLCSLALQWGIWGQERDTFQILQHIFQRII